VFCWNVATWELREAVNETAGWYADDVDEFEKAGLEKIQGTLVNAPMVARSPIRFECEYYSTLRLPGNPPMGTVDVVVGRVVGIHIDEAVLTEGKIDIGKVMPIARCGYFEYAVIRGDAIFEMIIPGDPKLLIGLEGNAKQAKGLNGEKDEKKAAAPVAQDRDGSD
jgi:flavin reductase (DIM6/NTAB) family NADH-FMN oxidoreductase RutF